MKILLILFLVVLFAGCGAEYHLLANNSLDQASYLKAECTRRNITASSADQLYFNGNELLIKNEQAAYYNFDAAIATYHLEITKKSKEQSAKNLKNAQQLLVKTQSQLNTLNAVLAENRK